MPGALRYHPEPWRTSLEPIWVSAIVQMQRLADPTTFQRVDVRVGQNVTAVSRKILLLLDEFSGHKTLEGVSSIRLVHFRINRTAHAQPMDVGVQSSLPSVVHAALYQSV